MKMYGMKYRRGTYDESIVQEVVTRACYRKKSIGFDVLEGERWLDLGANIGAFAMYCELQGASHVDSYEPDPTCFALLQQNSRYKCIQAAVTGLEGNHVEFYQHSNKSNYSRGSIIELRNHRSKTSVRNVFAGSIKKSYDGIKMDIEGSEFSIFDNWCLPDCNKLVLEYHTSRDTSVARFHKRMNYLRTRFDHVWYPREFDKALEEGKTDHKAWVDRLVFCWNES